MGKESEGGEVWRSKASATSCWKSSMEKVGARRWWWGVSGGGVVEWEWERERRRREWGMEGRRRRGIVGG